MTVVIIGGDDSLDAVMNELIEDSQCYLFNVLCGGQSSDGAQTSASYKWAVRNGAPVQFLIEPDIEKLIDKIVQAADFLVAYNDGSQIVKRIIMKFKTAGKHGKVINI